jgi:nitroimidazol reductase NimA-like FMN-containing flavoprotein (pyridoxamine 5'-phosphate oxidase superfamily)
MHYPMRRIRQQLPKEMAKQVLERNTSGVLCLVGADGDPYGVPLSYAYDAGHGRIFFHCALKGRKLDAIRHHAQACFTVIDQDRIVEEEFTTYFRSVMAFGPVRILSEDAEKRQAIEFLSLRFAPADDENRKKEIERLYPAFLMLELTVEELSGKEAKELVQAREKAGE